MMKWCVKEMVHRKFGLWFVPSAKTDKWFHALMLTQSELGSQETGKHRYHLGNCTTNSSKIINLKMSSAKGWGFCSNIYVSIWYPLPTNHLIYMVWSNKKQKVSVSLKNVIIIIVIIIVVIKIVVIVLIIFIFHYHYCLHYFCYDINIIIIIIGPLTRD